MDSLNEPMTDEQRERLAPIAEKIATNGDCSEEILDLLANVYVSEIHFLLQLVVHAVKKEEY